MSQSLRVAIPEDNNTSIIEQVPSQRLSPQSSSPRINRNVSAFSMDTPYTVEILEQGDSQTYAAEGDVVELHYTAFLMDGTQFESSYDKGEPLKFKVGIGRVIRGWDEAIPKLSLGCKANLSVRSDYAYGPRTVINGLVPPDSNLRFELQIIRIRGQATE